MRFTRSRRIPAVDSDHMKALHEECMEQLALTAVAWDGAQSSAGSMRDRLDDIAQAHWNSYIETIHLLCMHDPLLSDALKQTGLALRAADDEPPPESPPKRTLLRALTRALHRHHRRMVRIYELRGEPIGNDLANAAAPDREYIAALLEMIHETL